MAPPHNPSPRQRARRRFAPLSVAPTPRPSTPSPPESPLPSPPDSPCAWLYEEEEEEVEEEDFGVSDCLGFQQCPRLSETFTESYRCLVYQDGRPFVGSKWLASF